MLHCSFSLAAAQLLVKMTSALQKSECCSATSAAQHSENCSATSVFACGMLQGWGLEGWGLGRSADALHGAETQEGAEDTDTKRGKCPLIGFNVTDFIKGLQTVGVSNGGGLPDLDLSFLFCPFWDFPDFPGIFLICSGMVRGFSRLKVPFFFIGLLRTPTGNSPETSATQSGPFPKKVGPPGLETPPFSFSQSSAGDF